MKRNAFKMKLKAGYTTEYKRRHDEIWPELSKLLASSGITDYSIYLDEETDTLFAFQKLSDDFDHNAIPQNPIVKKWWKYMSDIMDTNQDNSPITKSLMEVFHMD